MVAQNYSLLKLFCYLSLLLLVAACEKSSDTSVSAKDAAENDNAAKLILVSGATGRQGGGRGNGIAFSRLSCARFDPQSRQ